MLPPTAMGMWRSAGEKSHLNYSSLQAKKVGFAGSFDPVRRGLDLGLPGWGGQVARVWGGVERRRTREGGTRNCNSPTPWFHRSMAD